MGIELTFHRGRRWCVKPLDCGSQATLDPGHLVTFLIDKTTAFCPSFSVWREHDQNSRKPTNCGREASQIVVHQTEIVSWFSQGMCRRRSLHLHACVQGFPRINPLFVLFCRGATIANSGRCITDTPRTAKSLAKGYRCGSIHNGALVLVLPRPSHCRTRIV